jgi:superfamily I DNA/RNA helicase
VHAARYALRLNCRNTPRIASVAEVITRLEPRYTRTLREDDGKEPVIRTYTSAMEQQELLIAQLEQLSKDGFKADQIVVLSARRDENAIAAGLTTAPWRNRLCPILVRQTGQVGFCSIHAFKGLEMSVVIVTDIEHVNNDEAVALLYVGLTRALHRLVVLVHEQAKPDILRLMTATKETDQ